MNELNLGIIGMSDGNGHPYSWAAIFNGYDSTYMAKCPFPVIPDYLSKRNFPTDSIKAAKVTHIWTQDLEVSHHISKSSKIKHVVSEMNEMIDHVDGVLLARDDPENHFAMSAPFLNAGLPIFIDKPLDVSLKGAKKILDAQQYDWQVFSCSSLRYASEFDKNLIDLGKVGDYKLIEANISKSWDKYGIHIIEPVLGLRDDWGDILGVMNVKDDHVATTHINWENGIRTTFNVLGNLVTPIKINIYGTKSSVELVFKDTYSAFKKSLQAFVDGINRKSVAIPRGETLRAIHVIEAGKQ